MGFFFGTILTCRLCSGDSPINKPPGAAGSPLAAKKEVCNDNFLYCLFKVIYLYYKHPSINNTSIDTLLVAADQHSKIAPPSEELQDKIHFLFNNLSSSNLQEKVSC